MWTENEQVTPKTPTLGGSSFALQSWLSHQQDADASASRKTDDSSPRKATASKFSRLSLSSQLSLDGPLAPAWEAGFPALRSPVSVVDDDAEPQDAFAHPLTDGDVSDYEGSANSQTSSAFGGNLLAPIDEAGLGISVADLTSAFSAQPPAVLQPEHANRLRNIAASAKSDAKKSRETKRQATVQDSVRDDHVALFLKCYSQRDLARECPALKELEEFVFSVPEAVAEAAQRTAIEVYTDELHAAVARKKTGGGGFAHYAPSADTPLEKLRLYLSIMVETNTALQKEMKKKQHIYPLAVTPQHHFTEVLPRAAGAEVHLFKDVSLRNPGSRAYRYWIHTDFFDKDDSDQEGDEPAKPYDFHVLSNSTGEVAKRTTQSVHISLIIQRKRARRGARELVVLESEFGFRHFLSINVVRQAATVGLSYGQAGVVQDQGFYVPDIFKRLRERFIEAGGMHARDAFMLSSIRRIALPRDWRAVADDPTRLRRCDSRLVALLLLKHTESISSAQGCMGLVSDTLAQETLSPADPLAFIHRPQLPYAATQLSLWWLALLSEILHSSRANGSRPRLLAISVAPVVFRFPQGATLAERVALHQQASQIMSCLLTHYAKHVHSPG